MEHCFLLLVLTSVFGVIETTKQRSLTYVNEFARVVYNDEDFIAINKAFFVKYNKTCGGFNVLFTIKQDLDRTLKVNVRGFVLKNNEFKKTVIDFDIPICSLLEENRMYNVEHILEHSNLTLACPIRRGTYYIYDIVPDALSLPPYIPPGTWMIELNFKSRNYVFARVEWIGKIAFDF